MIEPSTLVSGPKYCSVHMRTRKSLRFYRMKTNRSSFNQIRLYLFSFSKLIVIIVLCFICVLKSIIISYIYHWIDVCSHKVNGQISRDKTGVENNGQFEETGLL